MAPISSDSRLSALSLRVLDVLEKHGDWMSQEDVIEESQYIISPGEAYRFAEEKSKAVVDTRDMDEKIASGRRKRTVGIINSLVQNGRVERRGGTGRYDHKELRLARRVTQVYVVRDEVNEISVHWIKDPDVAVHVIDVQRRSGDPAADARALVETLEGLPYNLPNREAIEALLRKQINRLNVDAAMAKVVEPFEDTSPRTPPSTPVSDRPPTPYRFTYDPTSYTPQGDET